VSADPLATLGGSAPPRKNGELHFDEAWESRVFGITMSLHEAGAFAWGEFQAELIASIGAWERENGTSGVGFHYWARWLEAFERLAARKGLLKSAALDACVAQLAGRPAGWDHPV